MTGLCRPPPLPCTIIICSTENFNKKVSIYILLFFVILSSFFISFESCMFETFLKQNFTLAKRMRKKVGMNKNNGKYLTSDVPSKYLPNYRLNKNYFCISACQSKSSKLVVISLDGLQKLIAYGHLTGNEVCVR